MGYYLSRFAGAIWGSQKLLPRECFSTSLMQFRLNSLFYSNVIYRRIPVFVGDSEIRPQMRPIDDIATIFYGAIAGRCVSCSADLWRTWGTLSNQ